jgi:transposase
VVASYGFNRTTIYRWLSAAATPGVGLRALHAKPATGRPRSLTPHQEKQVFRWINGRDPRQYGLVFGLWTRSLVAALIERKFAIRLGVTAVGELLAKLGLWRRSRHKGVPIRNAGATIWILCRRGFVGTPFALCRSRGRASSSLGGQPGN